MECRHLLVEKQADEYCGAPCSRAVVFCNLDCSHDCEECDKEGNYIYDNQEDKD